MPRTKHRPQHVVLRFCGLFGHGSSPVRADRSICGEIISTLSEIMHTTLHRMPHAQRRDVHACRDGGAGRRGPPRRPPAHPPRQFDRHPSRMLTQGRVQVDGATVHAAKADLTPGQRVEVVARVTAADEHPHPRRNRKDPNSTCFSRTRPSWWSTSRRAAFCRNEQDGGRHASQPLRGPCPCQPR